MKITVSKLPKRTRIPLNVFCEDNGLELNFVQKGSHFWSVSSAGWGDQVWVGEGHTPIAAAESLAKLWSDEQDEVFVGGNAKLLIEEATK